MKRLLFLIMSLIALSCAEKNTEFEKTDSLQTKATSLDAAIQAEKNAKASLGYTYIGGLNAFKYHVSQQDYEGIKRDICTHTSSQYNCEEVSLFFTKHYYGQKTMVLSILSIDFNDPNSSSPKYSDYPVNVPSILR